MTASVAKIGNRKEAQKEGVATWKGCTKEDMHQEELGMQQTWPAGETIQVQRFLLALRGTGSEGEHMQ